MSVESIHGRGATRNRTPTRFNLKEHVVDGDWLDQVEALDDIPRRKTTVTIERAKTILTRNNSPDIGFDRSVNAYRGCEHGCIYCFARPSHAYHDLSPGVDFESRLFVKPDAAKLLHSALSRPGYECAPIAMGTNTDPYQPIEERWRVTRSLIELLLETRHPFTITTKSDRVLRDLDLLVPAAGMGIAAVAISITSLDAATARILEPRAPAPHKRLAAVKALSAGWRPVPCRNRSRRAANHRSRTRRDRRGGRRRQGARCILPACPTAARSGAPVSRLARRPLPRPRVKGDGDNQCDARRQGQ